eukprot:15350109-Ditylum_brightwellii.AAC.1
MAYVIQDGPSHLGGCKFTPLYHLQGSSQIQNFLCHYRMQSNTKKLLQIAVTRAQHQFGMSEPILWGISSMLLHLEARWLPSLHSYLGATGLCLQLSYTGAYPPQREHDQHIMPIVINSNAFKLHEIKRINYCRLYLGVTTLSDTTLADGETLDPHMRSGNISLLSSSAKQLLAKQGCPNQNSWKTCGKCLKMFANDDQLKVPPRQWFVPTSDLQRNWPIYLDYNKDILYVRLADSDTEWTPTNTSSL